MTRYIFTEIAVKGVRKWTDADGKKRQETRKFSQTLNPFNKRADGEPKTEFDIRCEINAECDAWLKGTKGAAE